MFQYVANTRSSTQCESYFWTFLIVFARISSFSASNIWTVPIVKTCCAEGNDAKGNGKLWIVTKYTKHWRTIILLYLWNLRNCHSYRPIEMCVRMRMSGEKKERVKEIKMLLNLHLLLKKRNSILCMNVIGLVLTSCQFNSITKQHFTHSHTVSKNKSIDWNVYIIICHKMHTFKLNGAWTIR